MKNLSFITLFIFLGCSSYKINNYSLEYTIDSDIKKIENYFINRTITDLIQFDKTKDGQFYLFKYKRDRFASFKFELNSEALILKNIQYFHRSFEKTIFSSDIQGLNTKEYLSGFDIEVFLSENKHHVYFCIKNDFELNIWVLINGNDIKYQRI